MKIKPGLTIRKVDYISRGPGERGWVVEAVEQEVVRNPGLLGDLELMAG